MRLSVNASVNSTDKTDYCFIEIIILAIICILLIIIVDFSCYYYMKH